jgi:hypothetical protein
MRSIDVPGVGPIQFPDNMSDDQIIQAIERDIIPGVSGRTQPAAAQETPTPSRGFFGNIASTAGDVGASLVTGAGAAASGLGGLAGVAGLGYDNPLSRAGRSVTEFGEGLMSPELTEKRQALSRAIQDAESQGLVGEARAALSTLLSNPSLLASMAIEQIPMFVLSGGVGRGASAVGQIAARRAAAGGGEAAEQAILQAGQRAGQVGAVGTAAGLQGGSVAEQTYQDVMGLPAETIQRSPNYQELLRTMSPDDARTALAERAAREAGLLAGGISVGTMSVMPSAERAMFSRGVSQSAMRRALGVGTGEAVSEGIEEGGGQFAQNLAVQRQADEERALGRGVGGAAATGAVLGGVMGAGVGVLQRPPEPPSTEPGAGNLPPELRGAIEDYVTSREPMTDGQNLLPREMPDIDTPVGNLSRSQLLRFMERSLPGMMQENPEIASRMTYARNEDERLDAFREILQQRQAENVAARQGSEEGNIRREIATSPETQRAFEQANIQQRAGRRPVSEQELRRDLATAENQVQRLIAARQESERRLQAIERAPTLDAAAREGVQAEIAQLDQLIAGRESVRRSIANSIPVTERQITAQENLRGQAAEAFDVAQARRVRFAEQGQATGLEIPSGTLAPDTMRQQTDDMRAGAPMLSDVRYVLNPEYENGRLVGGENVVEIGQADNFGNVLAYVERREGNFTRTVPVETTMDQLAQIPIRETSRMTQEAAGARIGPEQIAGRAGRGVDPLGQDLQPRRMVDRKGPEASARQTEAEQTAAQAEVEPSPADARLSRRVEAQNKINALYLDKLKGMGAQGRLLRNALVQTLKDRSMSAQQVYAAFTAADTLAPLLPAGANHRVEFVKEILPTGELAGAIDRSGGNSASALQGLRIRPSDAGLDGLITISLAPDVMPYLGETAAHEAFHVLQDYYGKYDPQFKKLMDQGFRDDMMISDIDPTIRRKLEQSRYPGSSKSYFQVLTETLPNAIPSAREAQAYAFGSLLDASRRGTPMTGLKPAFARFVNFTKDFFSKLGSKLRGDGFQTAEEVLSRAGSEARTRFDQMSTPTDRDAQATGPELSARTPLASDPAFAAVRDKLTGKDLDKPNVFAAGLRRFTGALPGEKNSAALIRTSVNRAYGGWMLDRLVKEKGLSMKSVGLALEVALNNSGRIQMYMDHGPMGYDPKTGDVKVREDVPGLISAIKGRLNIADKKDAQAYLVALRERDLRKAGKQGFFNLTDAEVSQTISKAEAAHPEWREMAADIQRINKALLDFAVDTGTLDRSKADQLANMFYTPFYRQADEDAQKNANEVIGPRLSDSMTRVKTAFDVSLKGGENPLGDLFENMIRNADVVMKAGLKNVAMRQAAEAMEAVGLGRPAKEREAGKTITYRVDGQDKNFEVDDPILYTTLAGAPRHVTNGIYQTMANVAGFFRDMITIAPSFMLANLWRGKIMAYVQEGVPFYTNTFDGLRQALKSSASYKAIAAQTGFGGYTYGMGERDAADALNREIAGVGYGPKGLLRRTYDALQTASEATEMAERIKLYERAKAQGMTDKEAAFQAYLLAPFSRRGMGGGWAGETINFLVPLVPFLNAKIQGMYRLIENEKGDTQKLWTLGIPKQMFLRGLVVMAASLALAAKNMEDEPERWDNENPDLKFRYDIIYMPGGNRILLPRAFEVGSVFGALPVFILDAIRRDDSRDLGKALADLGSSTFFFNPLPAAIVPLIGAATNYDFFRARALETASDRSKLPEERVNRSTSAVAKFIGEQAGISPIRVQYVLEGYSGTIGANVLAGFDSILASAGLIPNRPSGAFGDPMSMPAIVAGLTGASRFYRSDDQSATRFVGDFYKIKEMTDQLIRSQNMAMESRDLDRLAELRGEEGLPLRLRPMVNQASTQISAINRRIAMIERGDLDSISKTEALRPLREQRDRIARSVVERARQMGAY